MKSEEDLQQVSNSKAQSSIEYLVSYGWAIVLIALVLGVAIYFISVPKAAVPNTCTIASSSGDISCSDLVVGTNTISSTTSMYLVLTNSNPYEVANVAAFIEIGGVNSTTGACLPANVIEGGTTVCSVMLSNEIQDGQYVSGKVYVVFTACGLSPNYTISRQCINAPTQIIAGTFTAHTQLYQQGLTSTTTSSSSTTSIAAATSTSTTTTTSTILPGGEYELAMAVSPSEGGTVTPSSGAYLAGTDVSLSETANTGYAFSAWDGTGTGSYSGTDPTPTIGINGPITETATFNTVVVNIVFQTSGVSGSGNVLTANGIQYTEAEMPVTIPTDYGNIITYTWNSPLVITAGQEQEVFNTIAGCGTSSGAAGSFTVTGSCALTGNYQRQEYLTMATDGAGTGTITPVSSRWEDYDNSLTITATAGSGSTFLEWTGTGGGSYSGTSANPASFSITNALSETATFSALTADLYVTENASDAVLPINTSTNYMFPTINVGADPSSIAITPDDSTAYVTNYGNGAPNSDSVSIISTALQTVTGTLILNPITSAFSRDIAIQPSGYSNIALVTNDTTGTDNSLLKIGYLTQTISPPNVWSLVNPYDIAFSPTSGEAFVTDRTSPGEVSIISNTGSAVLHTTTLPNTASQGEMPSGIAVSPNGATAYTVTWEAGDLFAIDTSTGAVTANVALDHHATPDFNTAIHPEGVAVTPDGQYVLVADTASSVVEVFRTAGIPSWVTNVSGCLGPRYIAIISSGTSYVTCAGSGEIAIIPEGIWSVTQTLSAGGGTQPDGIAVIP